MSSSTTVPINPSSALAIDSKPEDQDTTLRCHLKLSLDNLSSSKVVKLQLVCECWGYHVGLESRGNVEPQRKTWVQKESGHILSLGV